MCVIRRRADGEQVHTNPGGGTKSTGQRWGAAVTVLWHKILPISRLVLTAQGVPSCTHSDHHSSIKNLFIFVYMSQWACVCMRVFMCVHVCAHVSVCGYRQLWIPVGHTRVWHPSEMEFQTFVMWVLEFGLWPSWLGSEHSNCHLPSCSLSFFF